MKMLPLWQTGRRLPDFRWDLMNRTHSKVLNVSWIVVDFPSYSIKESNLEFDYQGNLHLKVFFRMKS